MLSAYQAIRAMRVLVADGDPAMRRLCAQTLARSGFERVSEAESGAQAAETLDAALATHEPVDLLCLGLNLPEASDFYSYEELRTLFNPSVLLFITPQETAQAEARLQRPAEDYQFRPVNPRLLLLKAEKLLTYRFLRRELRRITARNETLFLNILVVMAKVLEAKDPYARYHSENVSVLATAVAREMGLEDDEVRRIGIAGILHDLGKLAIREAILKKPGPLNAEEQAVVRRHPLVASTILEPIEQLQDALSYIRHHHERYDGTGYPVGLAGEEIPLGARIIHLAEAFDTMTSRRSYGEPRSAADALEELRRLAGIQFDPRAVQAFLAVFKRRPVPLRRPDREPAQPLATVLVQLTVPVAVAPRTDAESRRSVAGPLRPSPGRGPRPES